MSDKCLHVGRVLPKPGWRLAAHRHRDYSEMIVVLAGEIETHINGQIVRGKTGDVLHYPRGYEHAERSIGPRALETVFVVYTPGDGAAQERWPRWRHDAVGRIRMIGLWMFEARPLWPNPLESLTDHLLHLLLHEYGAGHDRMENEMVQRVKRHVRDHLAAPLTLDDLASVACMSRFHFARQFTRHAGAPPMRFVRDTRIDAARSLLLTTQLPHREIARHVGFSDERLLSRIFQRETGQAPSQLRRGGS